MSSSTAPRRARRHHLLIPPLVGGASGVVIGAVLALTLIGPPTQHTVGPYVLNSSNPGVSLSFPDCAQVTVHWRVVAGPEMNFSVGQGDVLLVSDCHDWIPPSNETCPLAYCHGWSTVPGPICFESGLGGACSFTATQPSYSFGAATAPDTWSMGNASVAFTVDYSVTEPVL